MCVQLIRMIVPAIVLAFSTGVQATSVEDSPIPRESTERFLAGVRDFAGGKLTPGPLYAPELAVELQYRAANAQGSPVVVLASQPPARGVSRSGLARGAITPYSIPGQTIARRSITPYRITSPWAR